MLWSFVVNFCVLFVVVVATNEDAETLDDMKQFANLAMRVKGGSLKPYDGSLSVVNINGMEEELDSFDRKKREISNHFLQMDPAPTRVFEDELPEELDDYVSSEPDSGASTLTADSAILQDIQLPMKAGSPAFKIIASKVYILYPSMFQDPNIFGRFSIPQSINMEGKGDLATSRDVSPTMGPIVSSMASPSLLPSPSYLMQKQQYEQQQSKNQQQQNQQQRTQKDNPSKRMNYRRQPILIPTAEPIELEDPLPEQSDESARERSIQTHMRGQIVVQNQDVNEYNTQKGY